MIEHQLDEWLMVRELCKGFELTEGRQPVVPVNTQQKQNDWYCHAQPRGTKDKRLPYGVGGGGGGGTLVGQNKKLYTDFWGVKKRFQGLHKLGRGRLLGDHRVEFVGVFLDQKGLTGSEKISDRVVMAIEFWEWKGITQLRIVQRAVQAVDSTLQIEVIEGCVLTSHLHGRN
ncbi:hypothetical protein DFH07DRAFT_763698 [Mycena maculata]|uniref:Uncharacterized protein n=1 Tax=Mycena maculata TaxID=230809 RepID=A0AAD7P2N8_9AGAR|nr:hypothetical protein DFH07DRAFT_763698 [Mycena maculata]